MVEYSEVFVGIDVAKERNAVAIAEGGRTGEVRYLGEFDASPASMRKVVARLAAKHGKIYFCYEAGPTGYGLHRLITEMGHACSVVAPSLIPRKPGDRVKTNCSMREPRSADWPKRSRLSWAISSFRRSISMSSARRSDSTASRAACSARIIAWPAARSRGRASAVLLTPKVNQISPILESDFLSRRHSDARFSAASASRSLRAGSRTGPG